MAMRRLNSETVALALLNGLDEAKVLDDIRMQILDREEFEDDDIYAIACDVFSKTSEECFKLVFQVFGAMFSTDVFPHSNNSQSISV